MRLTPPQAVALAHWTPGVAALRPLYPGSPTWASVRAIHDRALLINTSRGYALTAAGCSTLAHLIATEAVVIPAGCVRLHSDADDCGALCWTRSRYRVGMSRLEGGPPPYEIVQAITWAPDAATWATMSNALRDDYRAGREACPCGDSLPSRLAIRRPRPLL